MQAQEIIENIESLLEQIANSDSETIQRDLNDDPFEPININILGNTYSYIKAEVIGQHLYHTGNDIEEYCDIRLFLERDDDIGARNDQQVQSFVCSLEWLKDWMTELKEYLEESEDDTSFYAEYMQSNYPLSSKYYRKSKEYYDTTGDVENDVYLCIGMALYHTQDNIEQAIQNMSYNHPDYSEIQKRAIEILKQEQGEK